MRNIQYYGSPVRDVVNKNSTEPQAAQSRWGDLNSNIRDDSILFMIGAIHRNPTFHYLS